jgi:hypothetical protein
VAKNGPLARIPGRKHWAGYESDLDIRHAHKLLFGRHVDELQDLFGDNRSIERANESRHMPRAAFQYYIFAFAKFVRSDASRGDADSASPFLRLLIDREKSEPSSVREIWERTKIGGINSRFIQAHGHAALRRLDLRQAATFTHCGGMAVNSLLAQCGRNK